MALVLTIGGVNRTSVLKDESLIIEHRAEGFISVCMLTLLDADNNIAIAEEDAITVVDGATTFFSGRVVEVYYDTLTTHSRRIHIKCQDKNAQLGEVVVDQEETFSAVADSAIIDSLFDDYLPAVDSETHVDTIQDPMTIVLGPCTLRAALSQISTRTGGYFYIDFSNALHYFSDEANTSAWWLSDDPDQADSFSYFDTPHKSSLAITRLDGVFVQGAGISGWRGTHGVGDRTAIVTDNRITTSTGVNERGDAILAKYGSAQEIYYVKTFKAGLVAGMEVRFICAIYGVDATFTVRQITVKWNASKTAFYELQLGVVVNPSLLGERIWIDVINESVGPISAPRLPTSSKGWSHSLVFSATDHDTVAWAAGGSITLADGTVYAIDAGNTDDPGAMATLTYVFLDLDTSETVLQITDDAGVAVGTNKIMIAVCSPVAAGKDALFRAFGGGESNAFITVDNIAAGTITTNEIAANTIEAGNMNVGTLSAIAANMGILTAGEIRIGAGTPGVDFTGIRVIPTYIGGYSNDVLQVGIRASDGAFIAGAEKVRINADGMQLVEGANNRNKIMWRRVNLAGALIGDIYMNIIGDTSSMWVHSYGWAGLIDTQVIMSAQAYEGTEARFVLYAIHAGIQGITGTNIQSFILNDGTFNTFDLSDGDLEIRLGDAAGAKHFKVLDSAGAEKFAVDSDGDITTDTHIATNAANEWNLAGVNTGTITPDRKIAVEIDGQWYTLAAQLGLV